MMTPLERKNLELKQALDPLGCETDGLKELKNHPNYYELQIACEVNPDNSLEEKYRAEDVWDVIAQHGFTKRMLHYQVGPYRPSATGGNRRLICYWFHKAPVDTLLELGGVSPPLDA